jgi:hypothetical protein
MLGLDARQLAAQGVVVGLPVLLAPLRTLGRPGAEPSR